MKLKYIFLDIPHLSLMINFIETGCVEIKERVSTSNGIEVDDIVRFFHGDDKHPTLKLVRSKGGTYCCVGFGGLFSYITMHQSCHLKNDRSLWFKAKKKVSI